MKKILLVLLMLAVASFAVFANGGQEQAAGGEDETYIAVISKGFQHQFWQAVKSGTEQAAEELGIVTTYEGPATEAMIDVQINMVENAIKTKCDGLVLACLDSEALIPYIEKANAAGIPVVTFDSGANSDIPLSHVATNNLKAGAIAAAKIVDELGGKGKVGVIVHDATSQTGQERRDGFLNYMKENAPGITVLEPVYGGGDHDKSADLIVDMIRANPDLAAIFAANEGSAVGAGLGLLEARKAGEILLVGFDSGAQQIQFLKDGVMIGFVSQDPVNIGYLGVKTMYEALQGSDVTPEVDTGAVFVDMSNLDDPAVQAIIYK